jgi:hypothetical protein
MHNTNGKTNLKHIILPEDQAGYLCDFGAVTTHQDFLVS